MHYQSWARFFLLGARTFCVGAAKSYARPVESLDSWLQNEKQIAVQRMLRNISPQGTVAGTVVASPSKDSPNYYFHWIRDSSLTIQQIVELYGQADGEQENFYFQILGDFIRLSLRQQSELSAEGLGEPRYLVDGSVDTLPWSRPQSDGPALRAFSLIHFLKTSKALKKPLDLQLRKDAIQVIRTDLKYLSEKWSLPCYDLWEELKGFHFYTQAVQFSAVKAGAAFFKSEQEEDFSLSLLKTSKEIQIELEKYWDPVGRLIGASRNLELPTGSNYKSSNLDTSIILAQLHSQETPVSSDKFLATAQLLEMEFKTAYLINKNLEVPAIGRFTDDTYFGGNPWYVTTAAYAEFYFRLVRDLSQSRQIEITQVNLQFFKSVLANGNWKLKAGIKFSPTKPSGQKLLNALFQKGDGFLLTLRKFTPSQGEMSEQFDRQAGVPVSARDLTWSYAAFLSALQARGLAKQSLNFDKSL